jgi:hypothetical protein
VKSRGLGVLVRPVKPGDDELRKPGDDELRSGGVQPRDPLARNDGLRDLMTSLFEN